MLVFVRPILPGKQEDWRRFCQVLQGSRRGPYEEWQQRLGITKELVWLAQTPQADMALVYLEAEYPEQVISHLAASDLPFDHWFRQQVLELHGLDLAQVPTELPTELIFVWSAEERG